MTSRLVRQTDGSRRRRIDGGRRPRTAGRASPAATAAARVVVVCALLAVACAPRDGYRGPWNVVVVMVDTLRADHLGAYGYGRDTSPRFDALAAGSVLFENARAQAPCTFPSANSALTSRDPSAFVGQPHGDLGIPEAIPDLATLLAARGYRTYAVSASPIVRATPSDVNLAGGFGRGFDGFEESCLWREAACVHRAALDVLRWRDGEKPFYLYLHYMDPHDPYRPPEPEPRLFAGDSPGEKSWVELGDPNPLARRVYDGDGSVTVTAAELAHLVDLYDDEIRYLDRHLGLLADELERRRLLDRTLFVVVSDHGESFLEGGFDGGHVKHCRSLFEREIRTPLLLRVPGAAPRRVATPVANLDLVPTVLDYVDERLPRAAPGSEAGSAPPPTPAELEGASLRALVDGGERTAGDGGAPVVLSSIGVWRAAGDDRWKLIANLRTGEKKLYDLAADAEETTDVLADNRRAYHRLNDAMEAWLAGVEGAGDAAAGEEAQKRLKALGYLQ